MQLKIRATLERRLDRLIVPADRQLSSLIAKQIVRDRPQSLEDSAELFVDDLVAAQSVEHHFPVRLEEAGQAAVLLNVLHQRPHARHQVPVDRRLERLAILLGEPCTQNRHKLRDSAMLL